MEWLGDPFLGHPLSVSFWLYGDGQKHHLTARLEDATGQNYLVPLGDTDGTDWREVVVPMDESKWEPMRLFADAPCPARWPVALRELRVERRDPKAPLGSMVFSELRAVEPLDRVGIQATTDAPRYSSMSR